GTPNYMAPEQIQGREVDHRADLFSLGVVLYEMLTRHKPFQGENLTVVSHRIVYDHFTPPQEYVRNLPPGLEPILAKALEKDPARRYQRAREMVDDLRRLVEANRQHDELNETQSLSATMALPPPPPPARPPAAAKPSLFSRWRREPAGPAAAHRPSVPPAPVVPVAAPPPPDSSDATAAGDASGSAAALPPLPPSPDLSDTNATAEVPVLTAPPPPKARSTAPQVLLVAGLVVVLGLLAGFLLWRRGAQPGAARTAAAGAHPVQSVPVPPAPAPAPIPVQPAPLAPPASVAEIVAARLGSAREFYAQKHYDAAITAANAALTFDPANAEARQILTRSQTILNRRQHPALPRTPLPSETVAAATPAVPSTPLPRSPGESASPAVPTTATMRVHLVSDFPDGAVLTVYVNDKQMAQIKLEASRHFLSRIPPPHDRYQTIDVPAGMAEIRAYVAPSGRAAILKTVTGNFTGGSSRSLEVQLSAQGQVGASLR
ncbi:MAG TPA: protein kinase, partial [Thermoanaerobaculia bacterium]|nr:protein kinase [Thermoanaerobaculia bacterium]